MSQSSQVLSRKNSCALLSWLAASLGDERRANAISLVLGPQRHRRGIEILRELDSNRLHLRLQPKYARRMRTDWMKMP
jgi:hypothetical protein